MKKHEHLPTELAMRTLLIVQAHAAAHPDFMMGEIARPMMERFGISRATAYRMVSTAVDVLCIPVVDWHRHPRFGERVVEGQDRAKTQGRRSGRRKTSELREEGAWA